MPKLLYILQISPCANNPLLQEFDMVLKNGLQTILNVQLFDTQWKLNVAPRSHGGTWSEERVHAGTSALLALAASMLPLQEAILSAPQLATPYYLTLRPYGAVWPKTPKSSDLSKHIQQALDAPVTTVAYNILMSTSQSLVDQARLKAVVTPNAGD